MRLKLTVLILAILLAVPFIGTALASQGQEQLVHQQFSTAYWSIWKHSNGTWQNTGKPGDNKVHTYEYSLPQNKLKKYAITRIEVTTGYGFDPVAYQQVGGWNGLSYTDYERIYLSHTPDDLTCINNDQDLVAGTVTAKWSFNLLPTWPPVDRRAALDLKDDENRYLVGFDSSQYANAVEGWLWFLPAHIKWYGIPLAPQDNLAVVITESPEEAAKGESITVKGELTTDSETPPVTTVVRWSVNGQNVYEGPVTVDKIRQLNLPLTISATDTTVLVEVNPYCNQPANELTWEDNKDTATIKISTAEPENNGQLILTARSEGGTDAQGIYIPPQIRQPGTAKWWDIVTATLKPPAPMPPKGALKSWSITSAKLTYPKKHPDWAFGHPLDPVGTTTINMSTGGRTANVQLREDWSNYGTNIYDMVTKHLIPGPTKYNISATYSISYTYEYEVKRRSCSGSGENRSCHTWYEIRTGSGTTSGSASAELLVNGTSKRPLAN